MYNIPFQIIDWSEVSPTDHAGESGNASWKVVELDGLRLRIIEYSAGYLADHWCRKGHVVHCLEGEFETELEAGEKFTLTKDMSYVVSDELSSHRSYSAKGVKLLIVDGGFLKP